MGEIESLICIFYLNCLSRFVPGIHWHVAGSLNIQPKNKSTHEKLLGFVVVVSFVFVLFWVCLFLFVFCLFVFVLLLFFFFFFVVLN